MGKWIPDRKIVGAGLGAVVAWLGVQVLESLAGVQLGLEEATAVVGAVATAVGYLVPQSVEDVLNKADEILKDFADEEGEEVA